MSAAGKRLELDRDMPDEGAKGRVAVQPALNVSHGRAVALRRVSGILLLWPPLFQRIRCLQLAPPARRNATAERRRRISKKTALVRQDHSVNGRRT